MKYPCRIFFYVNPLFFFFATVPVNFVLKSTSLTRRQSEMAAKRCSVVFTLNCADLSTPLFTFNINVTLSSKVAHSLIQTNDLFTRFTVFHVYNVSTFAKPNNTVSWLTVMMMLLWLNNASPKLQSLSLIVM